ncbi:hypothetical protein [Modicisalibacter zincidurans]|uniref:Pentapeptide MXKDX repeat protein n=1 Tax=Modicisalibacter zincidurans TaxID=1178777 RepID=A0ABP9RCA4_9GAMM|nr:hypothetical protein [Halomonas zincidurans]MEA3252853.1 hypothetical protein [Pseudomonadota bacterium]
MESATKKATKLHAFAASLLLTGLLTAGSALANEPTGTSTEGMSQSGSGGMSQECSDAMKDSNGQCPDDMGTGTSGSGSNSTGSDSGTGMNGDSMNGDSMNGGGMNGDSMNGGGMTDDSMNGGGMNGGSSQ